MTNFQSDLELDIVGLSQIVSHLEGEGDTTSLQLVHADDKSHVPARHARAGCGPG
jgi:hypothetical protein